jgi:hypothetical protein
MKPSTKRSVFIDAGHHDIVLPESASRPGEPVRGPQGTLLALTTPASQRSLEAGIEELLALRRADVHARLGVFVGDIALPYDARPRDSTALAPSFIALLESRGLSADDVTWVSETVARNRGKKLIDRTRHRYPGAVPTYAEFGWALCTDGEVTALVSDRTLEGSEGITMSVLTRGQRALCSAILLGHKHLIARDGFTEHKAFYSQLDDPYIGRKLWAAALSVEAMTPGCAQLELHEHVLEMGERGEPRTWTCASNDLAGPGELDIAQLEADLNHTNPSFWLVESQDASRE